VHNPYAAPTASLTPVLDDVQTYTPRMFSLRGRIGRLRYLAYNLGYLGLMCLVLVLPVIGLLLVLPLLVFNFALHTRRLNDMQWSGWWSVFMVVPYLNIIPGLFLLFGTGDEAANLYGPAPAPNTRALVLGATLSIPAIGLAGVLAAIAIPAYQDHVKTQAQSGTVQVLPASGGAEVRMTRHKRHG